MAIMRILLAEDDPVTRATLQAVLAGQGHDVTEVENGRDAWGAWELSAPRIVVADWLMPEMDGLQLCRKIRAVPRRPYTYFILQTSRSGPESFLEAMEAGIDDFITKPVAREELSTLEGLLAVCSYCKRIRQPDGSWGSLERYIEQRSKAEFSHGVCPECYEKHLKPRVGA